MVNHYARLDGAFSALGDPTRRGILARLALGEATVSELARPFPVTLPAISKHLRVLEEAGLIRRRKEGREHRCTLEPTAMREAAEWISHYSRFWAANLESLERHLLAPAPRGGTAPAPARRGNAKDKTTVRSSNRRSKRRRKP